MDQFQALKSEVTKLSDLQLFHEIREKFPDALESKEALAGILRKHYSWVREDRAVSSLFTLKRRAEKELGKIKAAQGFLTFKK